MIFKIIKIEKDTFCKTTYYKVWYRYKNKRRVIYIQTLDNKSAIRRRIEHDIQGLK